MNAIWPVNGFSIHVKELLIEMALLFFTFFFFVNVIQVL